MRVIDGRVGYFIRHGVLTAVDPKLSKTLWQLRATHGIIAVAANDGLVSVTVGTGVIISSTFGPATSAGHFAAAARLSAV